MSNSSKVMVALLAGLAAGTAFGVLAAPREGRELRVSLCGRANDQLWKFSKWRGRVLSVAKALLMGPAPEMPDDLEHA
jgi:gas vesicle protein